MLSRLISKIHSAIAAATLTMALLTHPSRF
jgi:hypothetical protein